MNDKKSFADKLNAFIFGEPFPVLSKTDLKTIRKLDGKLDTLLTLLNTRPAGREHGDLQQVERSSSEGRSSDQTHESIDDLTAQVRKLAKTQFKANTLQETQLTQQQETITSLQKSIDQQEKQLTELIQQSRQAVESARLELVKSLLPVLDSLDAAFESGRRQVLKQPMPPETRRAVIAWLDGIRLARMRLQDALRAHGVAPIPTIGTPFDPTRHVAVATDATGRAPDGIIIGEDRRGYATPEKVLRFAEVTVAQMK